MTVRRRSRARGVRGQVKMRDPADLVPHPRNSRTHTQDQVAKVAESIRRFGFNNPVLVKGDVIVAGHARVEAAKLAGVTEVPTLDLSHMTDDEVRAYLIADNRHAENAGWDREVLRAELGYLEEEFGPGVLGFDDASMAQIMADEGFNPQDEWRGMPEFRQEDKGAFRSITVHFKDQESVDAFAKALNRNLAKSTKFIWYPEVEIETYVDKRYVTRDDG